MAEFMLTFGQKYAREPHPLYPAAHPDGYVVIEADDYDAARLAVANTFAIYWCDLYTPETWQLYVDYFPRGELGRITAPPSPRADNTIKGG